MIRAFQACTRVIRRSPNVYAVISGLLLVLATPIYFGLSISAQEGLKTGALSAHEAPVLMAAIMGQILDSYHGGFVVLMTICLGFTMILLGATRILNPKDLDA
jgi:hypothetical protein